MDKGNSEVIALSLLTAGEMAHSFSAYMPSRFTIRNWVLDGANGQVAANVANLRSGYAPSLIFGLGLGAVISAITRSPMPLFFSAATGAVMLSLYEQALPEEMRLGPIEAVLPQPAAPCPPLRIPSGIGGL